MMPGYLPQLSRPSGSGDSQSLTRHPSQLNDMGAQSSLSSQSNDTTLQPQRSLVSMSSLVQWQVTTAAGLRDKEEKLKMTNSLADRQKIKIEELRKSNEMLGTDLARSKEENKSLGECLFVTKEEVEVMAKQVKTVSAQIRRIRGEREELNKVKEERGQDIRRLAESFNQLQLIQVRKEKSWMEDIKERKEDIDRRKIKIEVEKGAVFEEMTSLEEKLSQLDDEKQNMEKRAETGVKEMTLLEEKLELIEKEHNTIEVKTRDLIEDGEKKEKSLKEEIRKLEEEERKITEKIGHLAGLLSEEVKLNEENVTSSLAVKENIFELDTKMSEVLVKVKEFEMEKQNLETKLVANTELVLALERKLANIEDMKVEIKVLEKSLKESEDKRQIAEKEYKHLEEVQDEKEKLEDENIKLSDHVHVYEAKVQNCKTEISADQDDLKLKSKDLCLLESKVVEMNATKKNKIKQIEKVKKLAESRGKIVSSLKSSSSGLQQKVESLKSDLEKATSEAASKKEIVCKLKEDQKNRNISLKSVHDNLDAVILKIKGMDQDLLDVKSVLASKTDAAQKLEVKDKEAKLENHEITANMKATQATQDKLETKKNGLKFLVEELKIAKDEKGQSEMKNLELKEKNGQLMTENDLSKKDLVRVEVELKLSVDKMETSESMKTSIKKRNIEIKNLEKEIKNAKRNQVTVAKRKEKLSKQFDKNKTVSEAIAADISLQNQKIIQAQDNLVKSKDEMKEKAKESLAKSEAAQAVKQTIAEFVDEAARLAIEAKTVQDKFEMITSARNKLVSEVKKDAQEFHGLLSCKDKEFSDFRIKLTKEVGELGRRVETMTRELEEQATQAKYSNDGNAEFGSQEKALLDISKQTEASKEEGYKLQKKLTEKTAEVNELKEKLKSLKTRNVPPATSQRTRTPLSLVKPGSNLSNCQQVKSTPISVQPSNNLNKSATPQQYKTTPASVRQIRTLLPSVPDRQVPSTTVRQSPVRSFLAPPPRNTPTSHHSRPKKKSTSKPHSTPMSVTPVVDFDSVMGVSDDMDSN